MIKRIKTFFEDKWKGILFTAIIGLTSMMLEPFTPSWLNSILLALLIGIAVGNWTKVPASFSVGVEYTSAKMLEYSLLFLAVGINYAEIGELGITAFLGIVLVVFILLTLTVYLSRRMNCPGNTGVLVGFGTAICGSSAIAALASTSKENQKEDVAIAMAVVNLLGTVGMLLFPMLISNTDLSTSTIGFLVGGSLHSVGNVAGAGFSIGETAGDAAITVKLARVALLTPGLIYITYLTRQEQTKGWKSYLKLPWYLIAFIIVSLLVSVIDIPAPLTKDLERIGKIILTIAMAGIGLRVSFKKLLIAGSKGLTFGIVIFGIQLFLLLGIVALMNS
jgi:uncharacterized integral membrane protein (TIGR00698 family)